MSETKPPAFQFYAADFMTDTMAMSCETVGIYIRLICYSWINGPIPSNTEDLMRITGCLDPKTMAEHMAYLSHKLKEGPTTNGLATLVQPRLEAERDKQSAYREQRRQAGIASGERRRTSAATKQATKRQRKGNSTSTSTSSDSKVSPSETRHRDHPFGDLLGDKPREKTPLCPHQKIVDLWHEILPEKPEVRVLNERRKKQIRTRWQEDKKRQSLEWWRKYFEHIRKVPFLMTGGNTNWPGADFDFVINATKIVKIIEGSYEQ